MVIGTWTNENTCWSAISENMEKILKIILVNLSVFHLPNVPQTPETIQTICNICNLDTKLQHILHINGDYNGSSFRYWLKLIQWS